MPAAGPGFHGHGEAPGDRGFAKGGGCYLTRSMKDRSVVFTRIFSPPSM